MLKRSSIFPDEDPNGFSSRRPQTRRRPLPSPPPPPYLAFIQSVLDNDIETAKLELTRWDSLGEARASWFFKPAAPGERCLIDWAITSKTPSKEMRSFLIEALSDINPKMLSHRFERYPSNPNLLMLIFSNCSADTIKKTMLKVSDNKRLLKAVTTPIGEKARVYDCLYYLLSNLSLRHDGPAPLRDVFNFFLNNTAYDLEPSSTTAFPPSITLSLSSQGSSLLEIAALANKPADLNARYAGKALLIYFAEKKSLPLFEKMMSNPDILKDNLCEDGSQLIHHLAMNRFIPLDKLNKYGSFFALDGFPYYEKSTQGQWSEESKKIKTPFMYAVCALKYVLRSRILSSCKRVVQFFELLPQEPDGLGRNATHQLAVALNMLIREVPEDKILNLLQNLKEAFSESEKAMERLHKESSEPFKQDANRLALSLYFNQIPLDANFPLATLFMPPIEKSDNIPEVLYTLSSALREENPLCVIFDQSEVCFEPKYTDTFYNRIFHPLVCQAIEELLEESPISATNHPWEELIYLTNMFLEIAPTTCPFTEHPPELDTDNSMAALFLSAEDIYLFDETSIFDSPEEMSPLASARYQLKSEDFSYWAIYIAFIDKFSQQARQYLKSIDAIEDLPQNLMDAEKAQVQKLIDLYSHWLVQLKEYILSPPEDEPLFSIPDVESTNKFKSSYVPEDFLDIPERSHSPKTVPLILSAKQASGIATKFKQLANFFERTAQAGLPVNTRMADSVSEGLTLFTKNLFERQQRHRRKSSTRIAETSFESERDPSEQERLQPS